MANALTAIDTLKGWLARYQELEALVEVLEQIGRIDAVTAEAEKRTLDAQALEANAKAQLGDAMAALKSTQDLVAKTMEDAQVAAEHMLKKAADEAAEIKQIAVEYANGVEGAVNAKAAKLMDETRAAAEAIQREAADRKNMAAISDEAISMQFKTLTELEAKIAAAKASIAQLLGSA